MSNENPSAEGRFGEKIVTAWFETVINPVINALSVEQQYLGKKKWTWQFIPGRLESIRYVRQMVPVGYTPNLDQFEKYHLDISENITIHDDQVAQLSVACMNLQRVILDGDTLKKVFAEVTTEAALSELGKSLTDLFFSGTDESEQLGWIAQEVINGTNKLPSFIGHSPIWNKYRNEFMRVLDDPEVGTAKMLTDVMGEGLLQIVNRLIEQLNDTRDQLSLKYDVPPVPTASMVAA